MKLDLLEIGLLEGFRNEIDFLLEERLQITSESTVPVDYFDFYKSVSSVYSSKIEGEEIDFDSYFKHKFLNVEFKADYTKKADDLLSAYDLIQKDEISLINFCNAHKVLSRNLLPSHQQGVFRKNPMFVINQNDQIEYAAVEWVKVDSEMQKLFSEIDELVSCELDLTDVFYYGALIHLVLVKIHPFQDGNGRAARLLEKWFLVKKLGNQGYSIGLEKNYYLKLSEYYMNIKTLGVDYESLDYKKALEFLLMTIRSLKK